MAQPSNTKTKPKSDNKDDESDCDGSETEESKLLLQLQQKINDNRNINNCKKVYNLIPTIYYNKTVERIVEVHCSHEKHGFSKTIDDIIEIHKKMNRFSIQISNEESNANSSNNSQAKPNDDKLTKLKNQLEKLQKNNKEKLNACYHYIMEKMGHNNSDWHNNQLELALLDYTRYDEIGCTCLGNLKITNPKRGWDFHLYGIDVAQTTQNNNNNNSNRNEMGITNKNFRYYHVHPNGVDSCYSSMLEDLIESLTAPRKKEKVVIVPGVNKNDLLNYQALLVLWPRDLESLILYVILFVLFIFWLCRCGGEMSDHTSMSGQ